LSGVDKTEFCRHIDWLFSKYAFFTENGVPKEDARFVLPYCFHSNFYCTANARELALILRRMEAHTLREINDLGLQLQSQLRDLSPSAYDAFLSSKKEQTKPRAANNHTRKSDKVQLLNYPGDPKKLLNAALDMGGSRQRALEQLCYTFRFNGISLSSITHMARHRMQSLIVPDFEAIDRANYIIPETIVISPGNQERYTAVFNKNKEIADKFSEKGFADILPYLYLSGNTLDILTTMNARELSLFFALRTCERAQWEIREYAVKLLYTLRGVSPELFNVMGPSCFRDSGLCPEGRLSCGKAKEICNRFLTI